MFSRLTQESDPLSADKILILFPFRRFDSATDSYTGSKRSYSVCPHCAEILNPKKKNAKTVKQIPYVEHFDDLWRQARMQGWLGIRKVRFLKSLPVKQKPEVVEKWR